MASTSTCNPQLEESAPSTSTSGGSSVPDFLRYEPPTTKLAFHSDKRYHVFLSFRGPDVRKTLVDHLFEALSAAGLKVYKDDENLEKGEKIWPSLEGAIKSSVIRIPVFSRGYAESVWCLKEAAAMLSTPDLIIPLFYHVNPTYVRYPLNESSYYKESFLKHYGQPDRHRRGEVDEWKHALFQICDRSGWSTDSTQGYEARLVKIVVNDLMKTLDRVPLHVAKHPVGMDSIKDALIQKLNLKSVENVIKVGIWGIGGIGKTTVAKALYNQLHNDFDAASFIFNVRTSSAEPTGLPKLQKKIIKDLTTYDIEVDNVDKGISLFTQHLGGKNVLLILDDVDAVEHLDALVGDWLCSGSRVIITSRDKRIFNVAQVSSQCIHEISGLEINESLQLFSWHAFLRASPSPRYEDLSKKIVEACKGHPLSLEVLGSYLYGQNDIDCWKEALDNITLRPEIHDRLYISYKALSDEEKEIFLDIACFFIGEEKTCPVIFWKSLYKMVNTAVSNLSMKLLIKIDEEGVFDMHDHLQDMGRSVAEKEGTRQWEAAHPSTTISNNNLSRLRVNGGNPQRLEMLYKPGLRYLHLQNLHIEVMTKDTPVMLPPSLIWLRMDHCQIKKRRHSIKGIALELKTTIKKRRHSIKGTTLELKTMQLRSCDGIDNLSVASLFLLPTIKLHHLELPWCQSLNNLPNTIGNLSQLQHLDLRLCRSLNNLPDTIGNLSQLQHLNLQWCQSLNNLPDTIGNLSQLQHLDLQWCQSLNNLPDTIGNLSQLQYLDLQWCQSLNNLPDTIGNLSQLQHLDLQRCESLHNLPYTIGNLSQLQNLNLNNLPDTIGNLSQLQCLDLQWCQSLNNLPYTIGNLSQLQHLDLQCCQSLSNLPYTIGNLSQLQHLNLKWCQSLNYLPDTIGNLSQLQHLDLQSCQSLNNLPDTIGNLSQLQHLDLQWCQSLNNLPDTIGNLSKLQHLDLQWCESLNNLPDTIGNLSQLQHLDLQRCESLNNLPDTIGNLSQLQCLDLQWCQSLSNLPYTIGNLSQLQHLNLQWCQSLSNLPYTIGNLSQLQHLDLFHCESLRCLPDTISNLSQLQHLDLRWCTSLNNLSDIIGNLSQVNVLR
ncbi:disease resistance protein RPV1 [Cryptomeria japonica]|uniref:disease resistance protein RPV1 n=1 Tax=Cryptomeria japonica TaxID=3369 RepID=UPI0025AC4901|nr:disease resistance protein RPV1 [Cryptomeria japonica]